MLKLVQKYIHFRVRQPTSAARVIELCQNHKNSLWTHRYGPVPRRFKRASHHKSTLVLLFYTGMTLRTIDFGMLVFFKPLLVIENNSPARLLICMCPHFGDHRLCYFHRLFGSTSWSQSCLSLGKQHCPVSVGIFAICRSQGNFMSVLSQRGRVQGCSIVVPLQACQLHKGYMHV